MRLVYSLLLLLIPLAASGAPKIDRLISVGFNGTKAVEIKRFVDQSIQGGAALWLGTSAGTDTITATVTPTLLSYVTGSRFSIISRGNWERRSS